MPQLLRLARHDGWLAPTLYAIALLGFGFGLLTLAGGGIFIVALTLPVWLALIFRARRQSRAVVWIAATPLLLFGGFLIAGLFYQLFL